VDRSSTCAVIGGGPAGLVAAETLAGSGCAVTVYDQMPSLGRKFLMAGIGGLNLTHSEPILKFEARYRGSVRLSQMIEAFEPQDLRDWCEALGEETFVGSSGRVFPKSFKASPLLRAWLRRMTEKGVTMKTRHRWIGWREGALLFQTHQGEVQDKPDAVVLALGGASWPRLGSDGAWENILRAKEVDMARLRPSNCGFITGWQKHVGGRFAGTPLKSVAFSFDNETVLGEAVITEDGIEGGAIYALSAPLRDRIDNDGEAVLMVDFKPDIDPLKLANRLTRTRAGDSLSNRLRKVGLSAAAIAIMREGLHPLPDDPEKLAVAIKAVPIKLQGIRPIMRAISTAGGITADSVGDDLMLTACPGVFVAGEMMDWEAPTGGYLLQGCFANSLNTQGALAVP